MKEQAITINELKRRGTRRAFFKRARDLVIGDGTHKLSDTALLAAQCTLAEAVTGIPLIIANAPIGNAAMRPKTISQEPQETLSNSELFALIVKAPFKEEYLFRFLPSLAIRDFDNTRWGVGIATSAVFAGAHNVTEIQKSTHGLTATIDTETIPLYQFTGGLLFWKMMRDRGLMHAVLAHSVQNAMIVMPMLATGWFRR